jgi:poly(3-hydroxybutyrate) depolymerase
MARARPSTPNLAAAAMIGFALAAGVASPACTCSAPSATLDGGDLMGVFAHDAGSDATSTDGGARRAKRGRGKDGGGPAPTPAETASASARAPVEGVCVTPDGSPDRDLRRTLGRPPCRGAQVLEWKDAEGSPRYACVVVPPGVETRAPLPLVVFFHDPDDDPSAVHKKTALPKIAATYDMTGDPAHRGFIVLAPQGRELRSGKRGAVFDTAYTGADNVDVATVDHFVAELDKKGLVDHRRIYTLGASYGGHMAATYAMMRADKVAAFGAYGANAPSAVWSCGGPPPPAIVVYRACDGVISCDAVERWLRARDAVRGETTWLRLGAANEDEPSCATRNKCTPRRAEGNHHRWPKGREGDILAFFARHALVAAAAAPAKEPGEDSEPADGER